MRTATKGRMYFPPAMIFLNVLKIRRIVRYDANVDCYRVSRCEGVSRPK